MRNYDLWVKGSASPALYPQVGRGSTDPSSLSLPLIFILVSHLEGTRIKVKNRVKIKGRCEAGGAKPLGGRDCGEPPVGATRPSYGIVE